MNIIAKPASDKAEVSDWHVSLLTPFNTDGMGRWGSGVVGIRVEALQVCVVMQLARRRWAGVVG